MTRSEKIAAGVVGTAALLAAAYALLSKSAAASTTTTPSGGGGGTTPSGGSGGTTPPQAGKSGGFAPGGHVNVQLGPQGGSGQSAPGGSLVSSGGSGPAQMQQGGGGGSTILKGSAQAPSQAQPYVPVAYSVTWPQNPDGSSTVDYTASPSGAKQYGYGVTMRVGDNLTVSFNDATAIPQCIPQAGTWKPGNVSGVVTCNQWSAVGWMDPNGNSQDISTNPMLQVTGGTGAQVAFTATQPGRGTLIFTRTDPSGNVNLTYSFIVIVTP